mmetsp:Transcript_48544/g.141384  ORF Transcript_48544/g.141384 Transcript_48544/m.141384 type:complete len:343 (-) Transcript_48544:227-1255(-)
MAAMVPTTLPLAEAFDTSAVERKADASAKSRSTSAGSSPATSFASPEARFATTVLFGDSPAHLPDPARGLFGTTPSPNRHSAVCGCFLDGPLGDFLADARRVVDEPQPSPTEAGGVAPPPGLGFLAKLDSPSDHLVAGAADTPSAPPLPPPGLPPMPEAVGPADLPTHFPPSSPLTGRHGRGSALLSTGKTVPSRDAWFAAAASIAELAAWGTGVIPPPPAMPPHLPRPRVEPAYLPPLLEPEALAMAAMPPPPQSPPSLAFAAPALATGPPPGPAVGSAELPTVGSARHHLGDCKPCAFFHTKGCSNGVWCAFCHLCDAGAKQRRKREKQALLRAVRRGEA